jgi:DNA-binding response OmpR family regulator
MSFRVLLVEDDLQLGEALRNSLQAAGYVPVWVRRAGDGLAHWESATAHAVVLDLNLPDGNGLDVLAARRRAGDTTPVLVVTARDTLADRLAALHGGADDYVIKPFATEELLARLAALLRRAHGLAGAGLRFGALTLDLAEGTVDCAGQQHTLTQREAAILRELVLAAGRVLPRQHLAERVWGLSEAPSDGALEYQIHGLRRKLGTEHIRTVRVHEVETPIETVHIPTSRY